MSCPDCTKGGFLPGEPKGSISTHGAYLSSSSDTTKGGQSKRAVFLLTDAFGLPLKNCKIIADRLAEELECDVWIPDYFAGKPLFPVEALVTPDRAGARMGLMDWVKFIYYSLTNLSSIIGNRAGVVDARLSNFIATIQEEKKYEKIGAVGYCFGGATGIRFGSKGLFHSFVICHPGPSSNIDVEKITAPTSWVCAQDDMFWGAVQRKKAEEIFSARKGKSDFVEYEFKDYKGTAHGFACRPNTELPEVMDAYEKAFQQTVNWFQKTLV